MHKRQRDFTTEASRTKFGRKHFRDLLVAVLGFITLMALAPSLASAQTNAGPLRSLVTTGSIAANSNTLTVANASGFRLGDWVIVEIGQEPGQGMRGTRGVGGTWPSRAFPNVDAMNANTGPNGQFVWVESTGVVYERIDNQWKIPWPPAYYTAKAVPRALQARITAINGNTFTLDKSAVLGVSGANVYLDVAPIINEMIVNAPTSVTIPAGNYAIGGTLWILDKPGFVFAGSGKSQTKFYSPKGVPSAQLEVRTSPTSMLRDFTIRGNWGDNGFGLNWTGSGHAASFTPVTDMALPQGSQWPRAINVTMSSHRSVLKDIEVIDTAQMAVMVTFADEIWAYRISNIQNDPMRQYLQWQYQWVNTTGGGCVDCSIYSPKGVIPGFEAFRSKNVSFIRPRGVNATFAANGAGGWLVEDADFRFTAGSLDFDRAVNYSAGGYPIFNINVNGGFMDYLQLGGTIRNAKIVQEGYVNPAGETLLGIVVQTRTPNIRIEGGSFSAPDFDAATGKGGSAAINAWGPGTYVANFRITGLANPAAPHNNANIYVQAPCIVNGGGNAPDPRNPTSIYFAKTSTPAEGCTTPTSTPVIALGSREPPANPPTNTASTGSNPSSGNPTTPDTSASTGNSGNNNSGGSSGTGTNPSTGTSTAGTSTGTSGGSGSVSTPGGGTGNTSAPATPSANGTRGNQVVDAGGAVWSLDSAHNLLLNGAPFHGGWGTVLLYWNNVVYHKGVSSGEWYAWNGATSNWDSYGTADPAVPAGKSRIASDFTGTGTSGILWRNQQTGENAIWTFDRGTLSKTALIARVPSAWSVVGSADFNGDGKADILWRDSAGNLAIWLMNDTTIEASQVVVAVPPAWDVAGTGDFDGDGKDDILWRDSNGAVAMWLMNGMSISQSVQLAVTPKSWTVAGTGDLDGDGKADIVWRNSDGAVAAWLMNASGIRTANVLALVPAAWSIVGVADHNGDGKADLLWRHADSGDNAVWLMNGTAAPNSSLVMGVPDSHWTIVGAGDYDGDGRSDILWRNTSTGQNAVWLMDGFTNKTSRMISSVPDAGWAVVKR